MKHKARTKFLLILPKQQSTDKTQFQGRTSFFCEQTTHGSTKCNLDNYILNQTSHNSITGYTEWLQLCYNKIFMKQPSIFRSHSLNNTTQ